MWFAGVRRGRAKPELSEGRLEFRSGLRCPDRPGRPHLAAGDLAGRAVGGRVEGLGRPGLIASRPSGDPAGPITVSSPGPAPAGLRGGGGCRSSFSNRRSSCSSRSVTARGRVSPRSSAWGAARARGAGCGPGRGSRRAEKSPPGPARVTDREAGLSRRGGRGPASETRPAGRPVGGLPAPGAFGEAVAVDVAVGTVRVPRSGPR